MRGRETGEERGEKKVERGRDRRDRKVEGERERERGHRRM